MRMGVLNVLGSGEREDDTSCGRRERGRCLAPLRSGRGGGASTAPSNTCTTAVVINWRTFSRMRVSASLLGWGKGVHTRLHTYLRNRRSTQPHSHGPSQSRSHTTTSQNTNSQQHSHTSTHRTTTNSTKHKTSQATYATTPNTTRLRGSMSDSCSQRHPINAHTVPYLMDFSKSVRTS